MRAPAKTFYVGGGTDGLKINSDRPSSELEIPETHGQRGFRVSAVGKLNHAVTFHFPFHRILAMFREHVPLRFALMLYCRLLDQPPLRPG
jgi:hypothetical protein